MAAVSKSILMVSRDISPVVLASESPPIFSLRVSWFFLPRISPSFSFLVFKVSEDGPPWSPAKELLSITSLDELPLELVRFVSEREISIAEHVFSNSTFLELFLGEASSIDVKAETGTLVSFVQISPQLKEGAATALRPSLRAGESSVTAES